MTRLKDRIAVVTGSSSGIGQGIAVRFAQEGARVVVDYVGHPEGAEQTLAAIQKTGGQGILCQADVTSMEEIRKLIDAAWQSYGGCDILVNNAGMEKEADFWEVTEADYDKVLAVNLKGPFFLTQYFVQRLLAARKPGRVINISSVHEDMVFPHFSTYCASKGGIRMLMRDLAVELGPKNITVNNIAPGAIGTPINTSLLNDKTELDALLKNIPLGRLGSVDEVAALAAFLASDDAAYITGSTYVIDGGLMRSYHEQ
ncbi:MAG TPA: glucose 1-dehydrogenase [Acidobacteriaceae bacterium]|nr:glucose 1-dehydrogenase [Acidobacteriaceae bacterium]